MLGTRWRTRYELRYILKHNFYGFLPTLITSIWTSIIFMAGVYVWLTWTGDFPNWFAAVFGICAGILIATVVYFTTKKSQDTINSS